MKNIWRFIIKMLKQITFEASGLVCRIEGNRDLVDRIRTDSFTYHYMIGAKESNQNEANVVVAEDNSIELPAEINYPSARFRSDISSRDVVVVGEYLLERARQDILGFYNISSACAKLGNKGVVFFGGATNLGKTSYMLSLVQRCGFDFVSDEKTLIDLERKQIPGGAVSIPTRKKIIRSKFFRAEETLPEYASLDRNNDATKASLLIYPHLDHGLKDPIYHQWKPLDFFWILTRDLSHEIRGGIRLVDNFSFLLPSLDTPELTQKRTRLTKSFCDSVPCYYFQGSWDQVAEYIPKFLKESKC